MATGDFDNDGNRDVAISTWEMMSSTFPDNNGDGHVFVYEYNSGWPTSATWQVELTSPNPTDCVFFGYTMVAANVDGDANDELIVSAPGGEGAGALENGAVYIYDYNASTDSFDLAYKFRSDPNYGGQQGDNFGWSFDLGDINGDGDIDLIVGARYWSEAEEDNNYIYDATGQALEDWTGAVYVFDHDDWTAASSGWNEVSDASLVIRGEASWDPTYNTSEQQTRGYFGARVKCVGDVNDDTYDDFIVAATRRTPDGFSTCTTQFDYYDASGSYEGHASLSDDCRVGKVYLFAGASSWPSAEQEAATFAKVIFEGEASEDKFGQGLASQGDLNGDGVNDIVISSNLHDGPSNPNAGRAYVFILPDYSSSWPSSNDKVWSADDANVIIDGPTGDNQVYFGYAMACDGNTNKSADSRSDLIVGAPAGKSCGGLIDPDYVENRGFAYVYEFSASISPGPNGDHLPWAAVANSTNYYRLFCHNDYAKQNPWLGQSVAYLHDDSSHNDDFFIGCPGWDHADVVNNEDPDDFGGVYLIDN